jgi:hypothetical protein
MFAYQVAWFQAKVVQYLAQFRAVWRALQVFYNRGVDAFVIKDALRQTTFTAFGIIKNPDIITHYLFPVFIFAGFYRNFAILTQNIENIA